LCVRYSSNRIKNLYVSLLKKFNIFYSDIYGIAISRVVFPNSKIVHLHGHPYWPEVFLKPAKRKAKYIHTVHQIYFKEDCYTSREWDMKKRLNELMYNSCKKSDVVISVAKWQQSFLKKVGIESVYIPNSIDIKKIECANPNNFREKYIFYDDFIVFPGDIRRNKRPDLFIELAKKMPDKKFIMIGNGIFRENIINFLKIEIPKNVLCLGPLPNKLVLDIFSAARVFVLTSKNETFSIALIEAMSCKKAIVAANNAGPKEIIDDGIDGFLFEPDNIDSLYE
ncbi:MAG TPA: glycosyltransferase family 4 protein, partial [Bacteroidales bacterium]|nr:glycosyltransferase family 4 protein [Bacteroidales bacterium]